MNYRSGATLKGRLMGLDYGLARLGIAISDPTGFVAREIAVIQRKSKREDFEKLTALTSQHHIIGFIVGLPSELDDPEGGYSQSDRVRTWVGYLAEAIPLPVAYWNEQLSSVDAQALAYRLKRPVRAPIDDLAARLILQSYLDAIRDGLASPLPEWASSP